MLGDTLQNGPSGPGHSGLSGVLGGRVSHSATGKRLHALAPSSRQGTGCPEPRAWDPLQGGPSPPAPGLEAPPSPPEGRGGLS